MRDKKICTIPHIITEMDLVKFKDRIQEFCNGKQIATKQVSVTAIPTQTPTGQQALMSVPSCYIEYFVTEQEFDSWKFGQKLVKP